MTQFVTNIIQNSLSGFVSGAVSTAGGVAGDAIAGLGNFVEKSGDAVGDGIARKFDGWGQSISTAYGGGPVKPTVSRIAAPEKKSSLGQQKALPIAPSTQRKALPAPSKTASSRPATKQVVKASSPQYPPARSASTALSKPKTTVMSNKPSPTALVKSKTTTSGKVVPQKQSMPQSKVKTPAVRTMPRIGGEPISKGPVQSSGNKSGLKDFKPNGGYGGPLNLGGLDSGNQKPTRTGLPSSQYKPNSNGQQGTLGLGSGVGTNDKTSSAYYTSSAAKVAPTKSGPGGYGGPLSLGSLA